MAESHPEFDLVGEGRSAAELEPLLRRFAPDAVILDVLLPGGEDLRSVELARRSQGDVTLVVVSELASPAVVEAALEKGADAFVLDSFDSPTLSAALRQALAATAVRYRAARTCSSDCRGAGRIAGDAAEPS